MKKRIIKVIVRLYMIIFIFISYYFLNKYYHFTIPCPIYSITNLYCPGCGITRCLFSILQFKFYEAFKYNPLVFILIPFFTFYFSYQIYLYIFAKEDKVLNRIPKFFWIILLIITITFGIIRNLPYFSFFRPQ